MITPQQFDDIIDAISTTADGLRKICAENNCSQIDFYRYLNKSDENVKRYARAREAQADILFDDMDNILNEMPPMLENGGMDRGFIQWQKNRADDVKWKIAKLQPKKYGDKIETTLAGSIGITGPRVIELIPENDDSAE